ncbi:MAG: hypothetical protein GY700_06410 [Propionibacteriaceae bacterium]|nr:hypothetical protein [Propionibacteriaceae bacterium]
MSKPYSPRTESVLDGMVEEAVDEKFREVTGRGPVPPRAGGGAVPWKWIAGVLLTLTFGAVSTVATLYSAQAEEKAKQTEEKLKVVAAEVVSAERRAKESSFPRTDGKVLETKFQHISGELGDIKDLLKEIRKEQRRRRQR